MSFKQYIKLNFPNSFIKARALKDQVKIEVNTLRQVGIRTILKRFIGSKEKWREELPLQAIQRFDVLLSCLQELCVNLEGYKEGGHTFYFPPNIIKSSMLHDLMRKYPLAAGIKIVKREGGAKEPFVSIDKTCKSQAFFSPSHHDLLLAHNLFYALGIGPRLYDLIELTFQNGDIHIAYILEHIESVPPSEKDCNNFIKKLKKLESDKLIKLVNWSGYQDMDFTCPNCNGNLLYDTVSKSLKYVDLQNFALGEYYSFLKEVALEASAASHFGQKSYLLGGEYLYQGVPGLNIAAKRSPAMRFETINLLLGQACVSLKNKIMIDVGCNIGLMGAQYLKESARWLHGFDMPEVIHHTERVLLSVGCTKFSLSGLLLSKDVSLTSELPTFLKSDLIGCVISYLAIRGHIGWLKELVSLPWEFMIYEGHEGEDLEMSHQFIEELKNMKECYIASEGWIADANSSPRYLAILKAVSKR